MMDGDAIKKIQEGYTEYDKIDLFDGRQAIIHAGSMKVEIIKPATPNPLEINTLSGILMYLDGNEDNLFVHIENYHTVSLISPLNDLHRTREIHIIADCRDASHYSANNYIDLESFVIMIMSGFVQDENTASLLKFLGSIRSEDVSQNDDDGISQNVMVRSGVTTLAQAEVPNPVLLRPYATFPEITQPVRPFVFRMKKGHEKGDMPSCALFNTDDTQWKFNAILGIRHYITGLNKKARIIS